MDIQDHADDMAEELAGNWQKFDSFGWSRRHELDDPDNWTIVYTKNRDSDLLTLSNAACIALDLAPFTEGDDPDVVEEHHGHWAVGWVDGYSIRVRKPDGSYTPAFLKWVELSVALASYPVLNDEDFSEREYEDTLSNIMDVGRNLVRDGAPEDWVESVYDVLPDSEKEPCNGGGGYPSEESVREALESLGWLDED